MFIREASDATSGVINTTRSDGDYGTRGRGKSGLGKQGVVRAVKGRDN